MGNDIRQSMSLHRKFGMYALELAVLGVQIMKALHISGIHAAALGLPDEICRLGDAQLAAHIFDLTASLDLLQPGNNLAFGNLAIRHCWSLRWLVCPETSDYGWLDFTGYCHRDR